MAEGAGHTLPDCQHLPATLALQPFLLQAREHWPPAGRHVLAHTTEDTVVVYQSYSASIAEAAAAQGHFLGIPGFLEGRIAWLKTNFLWMMYRSGWASKPGQEGVLAITLQRSFFERLLAESVPTASEHTPKGACRGAPVVLQWDPDHLPDGSKHPGRRAVQLGVRGVLRDEYISGAHTVSIEDITPFVREMAARLGQGSSAATAAPEGGEAQQLLAQAGLGHSAGLAGAPSGRGDSCSADGGTGAEPGSWAGLLVPAERVLRLESTLAEHIHTDAWDGAAVVRLYASLEG